MSVLSPSVVQCSNLDRGVCGSTNVNLRALLGVTGDEALKCAVYGWLFLVHSRPDLFSAVLPVTFLRATPCSSFHLSRSSIMVLAC